MCKEICFSVSLTREAKLKRILVGYLVKTFIKGKRRRPVKLNNKSRKHLTFNSLGIGLPY